jgi:hypothetical protein
MPPPEWSRFFVILTLQGGYRYSVRGDHIVSVTEMMQTISGGGPRSRVLLTNGHTAEVKEEDNEILERWSSAVQKIRASLDE